MLRDFALHLAALDAAKLAPVVISLVALLVALYGVRERTSDRRRTRSLRYSEVLDELSESATEQAVAFADGRLNAELRRRFMLRQRVLADEASALLAEPGVDASSDQLVQLALLHARLGNVDRLEALMSRAVQQASLGSAARALALREYAALRFFAFDDAPGGRQQFAQLVQEQSNREDDPALLDLIETFLLWARSEADTRTRTYPQMTERQLGEAEAVAERLRTVTLWRAAVRRIGETRSEIADLLASPSATNAAGDGSPSDHAAGANLASDGLDGGAPSSHLEAISREVK